MLIGGEGKGDGGKDEKGGGRRTWRWDMRACPTPCATRRLAIFTTVAGIGLRKTRLARAEEGQQEDVELLRGVSARFERALGATTVVEEEEEWTDLLDVLRSSRAPWAKEARGRAFGNRGNARARMGRLKDAVDDYGRALEELPEAVDPRLNRGVAMEALGRLDDAQADYEAVLEAVPDDPAAWNNLGNVSLARREYRRAADQYDRAYQLSPQFAFAAANAAIARYAAGDEDVAMKEMRSLLRRYAAFDDVRAALAAALWRRGNEGEAETQWNRVDDARYKDPQWLRETRKWPSVLVDGLESLLNLESRAG